MNSEGHRPGESRRPGRDRRVASGLILAFVALTLVACSDPPVGSAGRPFTMYFVPSVDAQAISSKSDELERAIEERVSERLGEKFHVETGVPASYIAVVEALGTGKVDAAGFNTYAYVLAKHVKGYPIEPLFRIARGEDGEETTYCGQILARADSGIDSVEDLDGKKFAYVDAASTSGYLLPAAYLEKSGVEPSSTVFARSHNNVITMIYQGQVEAGATYHSPAARIENEDGSITEDIRDARMRVRTQYPDVEEKIKIVALTDEVPNEPWVIRTNLDPDPERNRAIRDAVREALLEFTKTEDGREALWQVATAKALVPADDSTYDGVRKLILDSKIDLEGALAPSE